MSCGEDVTFIVGLIFLLFLKFFFMKFLKSRRSKGLDESWNRHKELKDLSDG